MKQRLHRTFASLWKLGRAPHVTSFVFQNQKDHTAQPVVARHQHDALDFPPGDSDLAKAFAAAFKDKKLIRDLEKTQLPNILRDSPSPFTEISSLIKRALEVASSDGEQKYAQTTMVRLLTFAAKALTGRAPAQCIADCRAIEGKLPPELFKVLLSVFDNARAEAKETAEEAEAKPVVDPIKQLKDTQTLLKREQEATLKSLSTKTEALKKQEAILAK